MDIFFCSGCNMPAHYANSVCKYNHGVAPAIVKQVLVIRKDLKMRRGKEIAQGAHAASAWLMDIVLASFLTHGRLVNEDFTDEEWEWLTGLHAKICLQVDSEAALMNVYDRAKAAGLTVNLITDAGLTEFGGVATKTCLAIGPHATERIDPITSGLKLY